MNDAEGLAELLHTAEITVVAVTVDTDGNIELDLAVGIIGLRLADILWDTRATEHDTSEGVMLSASAALTTPTPWVLAYPDTVIRQQLLGLVDTVTELSGPLVDVVKKTDEEYPATHHQGERRQREDGHPKHARRIPKALKGQHIMSWRTQLARPGYSP